MDNLVLVIVAFTAIANLVTAVLAFLSLHGQKVNAKNIQKIEIATNSMKDALVAATGSAKFGEGMEAGRAAVHTEAAAVAAAAAKV